MDLSPGLPQKPFSRLNPLTKVLVHKDVSPTVFRAHCEQSLTT